MGAPMFGRLLVVLSLTLATVVPVADANESAGYGPIRLGMSIAQVRAALPNVAWDNPREDGDPNDPTVARAKKAPIGDESFDINYVDGSWGAFSLGLNGKSPGTSDQCRQRILKFLAAVEAANGTLGAKPAKPGFTGRTETIRFGKSSEGRALSIATPSGEDGSAITAERKAGHVESMPLAHTPPVLHWAVKASAPSPQAFRVTRRDRRQWICPLKRCRSCVTSASA